MVDGLGHFNPWVSLRVKRLVKNIIKPFENLKYSYTPNWIPNLQAVIEMFAVHVLQECAMSI